MFDGFGICGFGIGGFGQIVLRCLTGYDTGIVAQLIERPLCNGEVVDSIPCRVIPKTLKMVLAGLSLGSQH